jgi:hypothetical protein
LARSVAFFSSTNACSIARFLRLAGLPAKNIKSPTGSTPQSSKAIIPLKKLSSVAAIITAT